VSVNTAKPVNQNTECY